MDPEGLSYTDIPHGLETPNINNKDYSIMSSPSLSNDINSSSMITDNLSLNGQDPNQSVLSNYLDTPVKQSIPLNNEIITVASPYSLGTTTTTTIEPSLIPLTNNKESILDPISVSSPPPLPNFSSSLPFTMETAYENDMKTPPPMPSTKPFSYRHKNKGKFKAKKIFDTISKKTCYWPTWIEKKSSEIYDNYCKALEYTLYHSHCAVCKNTLVVDHIPYIEKMLEIENASFESSIKCNGRKRRSASGRISKIYRHLAEIDESQVNMLIDWNMVPKLYTDNDFHRYKSGYKNLISNLENALQAIKN